MIRSTQFQAEIAIYVIVWLTVIVTVLIRYSKRKVESSGFTFIYISNLVLLHLVAAFSYILPSNWFGNETLMLAGFRESTYAIGSFALGNIILAPFFIRLYHVPRLNNNINTESVKSMSRVPKLYFIVGAVFYFIILPKASRLPTVTALVSGGGQLMIAGICLLCWQAYREKNMAKLRKLLLLSLIFPFITIVRDGYLGSGAAMTIIIFIFAMRLFRVKLKVLIIGAICTYLALSFYQTYIRDKAQLRALAWSGAPFSERIKAMRVTLTKPELFNPLNSKHIERIEARINQNILIGYAVNYIRSSGNNYAYGKTIWEAVLALIPRIFWPEKYLYAGSGNIVSQYTGLRFDEETSVGVGQIMEFYINFGRKGVIIGFLILGIIIAIIDIKSGHYLISGNLQRFVLWFLPGIAFCNIGGSLVELTSSAGAAIAVAWLVAKLVALKI